MIKLIRGYIIDGRAYDYALQCETKSVDKDGKMVYRTIGNYSSVENCIMGLQKTLRRELVAEEVLTLEEAKKRFEDIANEIKAVMPECFK